jgi:sugar lactone lactonase YvrE
MSRGLLILILLGLIATPEIKGDTFYVSHWGGTTIERFNQNGSGSVFASGLSRPQGLAFGPDGRLYAAQDGQIVAFNSSSGQMSVVMGGLNVPAGIAFDSSGNLFVADYWGHTITKRTPNGTVSVFVQLGFQYPDGLTFDAGGNLYVAYPEENRIMKYNSSGIGTPLPLTGLSQPRNVIFDSFGNLFIASSGNNIIYKYSPDGVQTVFANSGLIVPRGMAFDSSGNLYVVNQWILDNIVKIDPNGNQTVFAQSLEASPSFIAIQVPEPATPALLALTCLMSSCWRVRTKKPGGERGIRTPGTAFDRTTV